MQEDKYVDLHVHTRASDGTLCPEAVVRLAQSSGLKAIAITDHDTMEGYLSAPKDIIEIIPGIELTVDYLGREIHVLGYFINPAAMGITDMAVRDRERRNKLIIERMKADGFELSLEELKAQKDCGVLGRPHIAAELVRKGYAQTVKEAFDKWLAEGAKYYEPRRYLSIKEAAAVIIKAGGAPVLAHPLQYKLSEAELRKLILYAGEAGIIGLEAIYPEYSEEQTEYMIRLAGEYGMKISGGSDFHGDNRPESPLGCVKVPYSRLEELRNG
jgi:predicted metal-dependent phosphoesterase TrpH